jgi:prevent-host-death family protein
MSTERRSRTGNRIVGVRDLKTHAARIVRQVREARVSYVVTHRGRAVGVIMPLEPEENDSHLPDDVDGTRAWDTFLRTGHRLERSFKPGAGGVDILSATRR